MGFFCISYDIMFEDSIADGTHDFLANLKFQIAAKDRLLLSELENLNPAEDLSHYKMEIREAYTQNLSAVAVGRQVYVILTLQRVSEQVMRFCFRTLCADGRPVSVGYQVVHFSKKSPNAISPMPQNVTCFEQRIKEEYEKFDGESIKDSNWVSRVFSQSFVEKFKSTLKSDDSHSGYIGLPNPVLNLSISRSCLLFPGQGSMDLKLLRHLYQRSPQARNVIDQISAVSQQEQKFSLVGLLNADTAERQTLILENAPDLDQYAIYAAGICAADVWKSEDVHSDLLCGHSFGEIAAFCVGGVFDCVTGAKIIQDRISSLRTAGNYQKYFMAALNCSELQTRKILEEIVGAKIEIAVLNHARQTVVSGLEESFDILQATSKSAGIEIIRLASRYAFHSSYLAQAAINFSDQLKKYGFSAPTEAIYLPAENRFFDEKDSVQELFSTHLLSRFDFMSALRNLFSLGAIHFYECGGRRVVTKIVNENIKGSGLSELRTHSFQLPVDTFERHNKNEGLPAPTEEIVDRPLPEQIAVTADASSQTVIPFQFSIEKFPFLQHHVVIGMPTVPGSMEVALCGQIAESCFPGMQIINQGDFRFLRFLRVQPGRPVNARIQIVTESVTATSAKVRIRIFSDFVHKSGAVLNKDILHFECFVEFGHRQGQPTSPPESLALRGGKTFKDPFLQESSPVALSGPFECLKEIRLTREGNSCGFEVPALAEQGESTAAVSLMLDGLWRLSAMLRTSENTMQMFIPDGAGETQIFFNYSDTNLSRRVSSLTFLSTPPRLEGDFIFTDSACAYDSEGRCLVECRNLRARKFGMLKIENGHQDLRKTSEIAERHSLPREIWCISDNDVDILNATVLLAAKKIRVVFLSPVPSKLPFVTGLNIENEEETLTRLASLSRGNCEALLLLKTLNGGAGVALPRQVAETMKALKLMTVVSGFFSAKQNAAEMGCVAAFFSEPAQNQSSGSLAGYLEAALKDIPHTRLKYLHFDSPAEQNMSAVLAELSTPFRRPRA